MTGHAGERRTYDTMRYDFCWPHMANYVYAAVKDCRSCGQNCQTNKNQRNLCLFPPSGPFKYVVMNILGPLPKIEFGNQFTVVMTDQYTKVTKAIPTALTAAFAVAKIFVDY